LWKLRLPPTADEEQYEFLRFTEDGWATVEIEEYQIPWERQLSGRYLVGPQFSVEYDKIVGALRVTPAGKKREPLVYTRVPEAEFDTMKVKVRARLREKVVRKEILNNLRQIAASADQFYFESGKKTVTLNELIGPTKYIRALHSVDGESYAGIDLTMGSGKWRVTTPGGVTVEYDH
jgi:hypothetical protein